MKFTLQTRFPNNSSACLILGIFEKGKLTQAAKKVDDDLNGKLTKLIHDAHFTAKIGETLPLFQLDQHYPHLLLVGCGQAKKVDKGNFRKILQAAIRNVISYRFDAIVHCLIELEMNDNTSTSWKIKHIVETSIENTYRFDQFKTQKDSAIALKHCTLLISDHESKKDCEEGLQQGLAISKGVLFTKNLANMPSNICTPSYLANQAEALANEYPTITYSQLNEKEMKKLGMGALLGVAQGSEQESYLINLNYQGGQKNKAPLVFVGKGITFDTGGNSLKPPESMVGMKYDMCGAATVMGVLLAAAELQLPLNIIGLIPAVENMPGGTAYKPEDILTSLSGQTIEVISTDAEGRLILADALTYAERFNPEVVIDIATLTYAVVIALGYHVTGMMSNDETLAQDLLNAGNESYDRAWQLPLLDEFQDQIKSPFADMANTGGRAGGSITAGCFLSRFAKKFRWAHLDVAGTAAMMGGTQERLATGRPVPLLMQYLINYTKHL